MDTKRYLIVTMVVFGLVALLHLVRLILGWPANIAGVEVPLWASAIGVVVAGALALWAFLLLRKRPA